MKRQTDKREKKKKNEWGGGHHHVRNENERKLALCTWRTSLFFYFANGKKNWKKKKKNEAESKKKKKKKRRSEEILWSNPLAEARLDIGIPSNPPPPQTVLMSFFLFSFLFSDALSIFSFLSFLTWKVRQVCWHFIRTQAWHTQNLLILYIYPFHYLNSRSCVSSNELTLTLFTDNI